MKYLDKRFSVAAPDSDAYRDNWERIFNDKPMEQAGAATGANQEPAEVRPGGEDPAVDGTPGSPSERSE